MKNKKKAPDSNTNYMRCALKQARIAYKKNEVPVGSIVVNEHGRIISTSYNLVKTLKDPLMHAEILAIRSACAILNTRYLDKCSIYTTLEPCHMCIAAITLSRIKNLFFGIEDKKYGAVFSTNNFLFLSKNCYKNPNIEKGFLHEEIKELMESFFQKIRKTQKL